MKHLLLTTIAAVVLVGCGNPRGALFQAVKDINIEAAKQAIADGADVNAPNRYGWTALHFTGNKEIAELLIAKGADVNAKADRGDTPLDSAIKDKHTEIADLLRKHGGKTKKELKALLDAVKNHNIEAVKKFLPAGTDVNLKVSVSRTPLHEAARSGSKKIADLLIDNGADVNAKDMNGMTPFHVAAYGGAREHFELLIAKGADVNAIIKLGHFEGRTPLDFAIAQNSTKNTDLLRKLGGKTAKELKAEAK